MKAAIFVFFVANAISLYAQVNGRIDLVFADGHVIKNAKIMSDDPHELIVLSTDGVNNVLKADLNAETRLKVGYDPKADADFIKAKGLAVKTSAEAKSKAEKEAIIAFRLSNGKGISNREPSSQAAINNETSYEAQVTIDPFATAANAKAKALAKAKNEAEIETSNARVEISPAPYGALAIKGVFVGMKSEEAIQALKDAVQGIRIIRNKASDKKDKGKYQMYGDLKNGHWFGYFYVDFNTGNVVEFYFTGYFSDLIFNTSDLSADNFAQKFMDNYYIPELHPDTSHEYWYYESPNGWTLRVSGKHAIYVFITPERRFD